jgi:hypothetical protein
METERRDRSATSALATLPERLARVLVRCAVCERDQALVTSHAAADRVLTSHLDDCPGPARDR